MLARAEIRGVAASASILLDRYLAPASAVVQHRLVVLLAIALAPAFVACVPAPRAPVDLETVQARAVKFGLAGPRATICPGEPVKLDVLIDAIDQDGDHRLLRPHRRELDDWIFDPRQLKVSSPQGFFDGDGTFYPSSDVTQSVQTGFVLYSRAPNGPAFSVRFPPSYECTARIGKDGQPGGRGPSFHVYVTWARTPDYTKVLAARTAGELEAITLVAPGMPLVARSRGGQGEVGAGWGGDGGPGGDGGDVVVVTDDRFDDLDRLVTADVRGGDGGPGGYDEVAAASGSEGFRGKPGIRGSKGTASFERGTVRSHFDDLGAIVPY